MAAAAAVAAPALIAVNVAPSATFLNQAAALVGWGAWAMVLAIALPPRGAAGRAPDPGATALLTALLLLAAAALAAPFWAAQPWTLALSSIGLLAAAVLVAALAGMVQRAGQGEPAFAAFCTALLFAGVAATLIGFVQVYAPGWADGEWIAASTLGDRAVGNLRQPNHQSSLLLWSMIATLWLAESGRLRRAWSPALLLLLLSGVVLTASRTGMVGAGLLALWGVVDRRLSRASRVQLWLAPLAYLMFYELFTAIAHLQDAVFAGEVQLQKSDPSSSRFGIWANTLTLIAEHPWAGVGFGEFNFAWSLHPFPGRPVAFFDHTHNLPLQFAVELGLPLAALVLALLLFALWRAWRMAGEGAGGDVTVRRAALAMVLMIALHSLLEYPLWYAYFLLPTAWAFGFALGRAPRAAPLRPRLNGLGLAGTALALGAAVAVWDYGKVTVIFGAGEGAAPLATRIERGQKSLFFAHHADYAAATTDSDERLQRRAFDGAAHYLLDTRFTMAWAEWLAAQGRPDHARHLAARLREFRNPLSKDWFAGCDTPPAPGATRPFQCEAPQRALTWRDFQPAR